MKKLLLRYLQSYFYMLSNMHNDKSKHYMRIFEYIYKFYNNE